MFNVIIDMVEFLFYLPLCFLFLCSPFLPSFKFLEFLFNLSFGYVAILLCINFLMIAPGITTYIP